MSVGTMSSDYKKTDGDTDLTDVTNSDGSTPESDAKLSAKAERRAA